MIKKFINKNKKIIFWSCICMLYASFSVMIFYDSAHYMGYVSILEGKTSFAEWDIVRGPVFPFIIYLSRRIFGSSHIGLLIMTFIFYAIMIYIVLKISDVLSENIKNGRNKKIFKCITLALIIFNPIIFGYYHALLTEFLGMTIALLMCYLSWKWIDIDYKNNKKLFIVYGIVFAISCVFTWHLKQPFVAISIFPVLISAVISVSQKCNLNNILQRGVTVIICFIVLFTSIKGWNMFLESKNLNLNTDRNVVEGFGKSLIRGVRNFQIVESIEEYLLQIDDDPFLSEVEKEELSMKIDKGNESFYLVNIYSTKGNLVDRKFIDYGDARTISTGASLSFILSTLVEHPLSVIEGYTTGYLMLSDLYTGEKKNEVYLKDIRFDFWGENKTIGMSNQVIRDNIYYMPNELRERVTEYHSFNHPPYAFRFVFSLTDGIAQTFYSLSMLLLPFACIFSFLYRVLYRKKLSSFEKKEVNFLMILLWFSVMNSLVYVATAACIDRYSAVTLIPMIISTVIIFKIFLQKGIYYFQNRKR